MADISNKNKRVDACERGDKPRKRRNTRDAILETGEELLQRRGFNGFSYHHIAVQLGIRNAAVHYHFPSKEDLGIELIRRFRDGFSAWSKAQDESGASAWDKLEAYFGNYLDNLENGQRVCFTGMLGAEFQAIPGGMREEVRLAMEAIYHWLIALLEQGAAQGSLRYTGSAEAKAIQIGAALQGGLQVARVAGPHRFHELLDQLRLELAPEMERPAQRAA